MKSYKIAVPKDDKGYTHRVCPDCNNKFGIRWYGELPDLLNCPYCDKSGDVKDFNIEEQLEYAIEEGKQQIFHDVQKMFQNSMKAGLRGSKNVSFKAAPLHRTHAPLPKQSEIPTDMECSTCKGQYVIYGIASRCSFCGGEDIKLIDANLATIEKEIVSNRALRQTYNDIVIVFQNECQFFALNEGKRPNLQNINTSEQYFRDRLGVELLKGIDNQSLIDLRIVFEKRHVEQHSGGIYDEKYIANLGASKDLIGQKVTYSKDELVSALKALVIISSNLRDSIKR